MGFLGGLVKGALKTTVKVAAFPITGSMNIYKTITNKGLSENAKIASVMLNVLGMGVWGLGLNCGLSALGAMNIISLGGATSTLIENQMIDMTQESKKEKKKQEEKQRKASGVTAGAIVQDANGNWILDLSKIDDNVTTNLPQGTYQSGTAKARAELLLLVQEICNQPEITITPEMLLGTFYNESSGRLPNTGSIFKHFYDDTPNGDGDVAPLYHRASAWLEKTGYKHGWTFMSKYAPDNTSGQTKVYNVGEYSGTTEGHSRPAINYLPDALYATAYRLSVCYDGREEFDTHWTRDYVEWGKSLGMNDEEIKILRTVNSCAYYNSYGDWVKIFIPASYVDLYRTYGDITQWYTLGDNYTGYEAKYYALMKDVNRTVPNFKDSYGNASAASLASYESLAKSNHVAERYTFLVVNAGRWMWEGLESNAKALGAMQETSVIGGSSDFISNLKKLKAYGAANDWSYSQTTKELIDIDGTKVYTRHDCSGLVYAALYLTGYVTDNSGNSIWGSSYYGASNSVLEAQGWTHYDYTDSFQLQPGDIYANPGTHVEVYAGDGLAYNWGDTKFFKTAEPTGKTITPDHVWRPPAASKSSSKTSVQMKNVSSGQQAVVDAAHSQLGKSTWSLYGTTMVSKNRCQAFTKRCWAVAGYGLNGFEYPKEFFEYEGSEYYVERYVPVGSKDGIPAEQIDWKTIPVGAGIISKGNYGGITPVHISTYIGDGEIIEAGASTVNQRKIGETCGGNSIFGWVAPMKLYEEAKGK